MRSVIFLVYIKIAVRTAGLLSDKGTKRFVGTVFTPSVHYMEFFQLADSVHVKEGKGIRNFSARSFFLHLDTAESSAHLLEDIGAKLVVFNGNAVIQTVRYVICTGIMRCILDNKLAGVGKFIITLCK